MQDTSLLPALLTTMTAQVTPACPVDTLSSPDTPGPGAFISGIDINALSEADVSVIRESLGYYGVVFFRDQSVSPEGHIEFAQHFGAININRFFQPVTDYPQIAEVSKEPDQSKNIGEQWHTDHSYDQIPALGSILVARELPSSGGDTLFSSMFSAYNALDDDMKTRLNGLTATHSSRHAFGVEAYDDNDKDDFSGRLGNTDAATQDAVHPVVIRHPISGKQAIYVNPDFTIRINELSSNESDALLSELYAHCQRDEFTYRFQWTKGSVAFWDNRATWHMAFNDYHGQRRMMHRITVEGVALGA